MMQARFIVVDEDRGGDVHGGNQAKTFLDTTPANQLFDRGRDVDEPAATFYLEVEMFGK
jgi:hypothetical protein